MKQFGTVAEWHSGRKLPPSAANFQLLRGLSNLIGLVAPEKFSLECDQFSIQKPIRRQPQFAVYAAVRLTEQPAWLAAFRVKYSQQYDFHVTLKQPCVIEDSQAAEITTRFLSFFEQPTIPSHAIPVDFNQLVVDGPTEEDACIMILAAANPALMNLQRQVVNLYEEFHQYRQPELKAYETNFKPHLTLIHNLEPDEFRQARADVKNDYRCQGVIEEVTLAVINDATIAEALNPKNLTIARL